jgi:AraC-like DNA-binding protein
MVFARGNIRWDGPALKNTIGLWLVREGTARHLRPDGAVLLRRPGALFFSAPGDVVEVSGLSRIGFLYFDIIDRPRVRAPRGNAWTWPADPGPHPPLAEVLGHAIPDPFTEEQHRDGCEVMQECLATWWLGDQAHWRCSAALSQWLLSLGAPDLTNDQALAERYRSLCADRCGFGVTAAELRASLRVANLRLHRACKRVYGKPPAAVLEDERMALAQRLLASAYENLDLTTVATRLGYRDASAFGRRYRQLTGRTPGKDRQSLLQQNKSP